MRLACSLGRSISPGTQAALTLRYRSCSICLPAEERTVSAFASMRTTSFLASLRLPGSGMTSRGPGVPSGPGGSWPSQGRARPQCPHRTNRLSPVPMRRCLRSSWGMSHSISPSSSSFTRSLSSHERPASGPAPAPALGWEPRAPSTLARPASLAARRASATIAGSTSSPASAATWGDDPAACAESAPLAPPRPLVPAPEPPLGLVKLGIDASPYEGSSQSPPAAMHSRCRPFCTSPTVASGSSCMERHSVVYGSRRFGSVSRSSCVLASMAEALLASGEAADAFWSGVADAWPGPAGAGACASLDGRGAATAPWASPCPAPDAAVGVKRRPSSCWLVSLELSARLATGVCCRAGAALWPLCMRPVLPSDAPIPMLDRWLLSPAGRMDPCGCLLSSESWWSPAVLLDLCDCRGRETECGRPRAGGPYPGVAPAAWPPLASVRCSWRREPGPDACPSCTLRCTLCQAFTMLPLCALGGPTMGEMWSMPASASESLVSSSSTECLLESKPRPVASVPS